MATIEFSAGAVTSILDKLCSSYGSDNSSSYWPFLYGRQGFFLSSTNARCSIRIMKGTVPTDFSALTNYTVRSTDILVEWREIATGYSSTSIHEIYPYVQRTTNPIVIGTASVGAVASGTATWFWGLAFIANASAGIYQQFIGTIGTLGSGSDLEISNTSIVSGNQYRINNLRWQLPTSYTY